MAMSQRLQRTREIFFIDLHRSCDGRVFIFGVFVGAFASFSLDMCMQPTEKKTSMDFEIFMKQ